MVEGLAKSEGRECATGWLEVQREDTRGVRMMCVRVCAVEAKKDPEVRDL